MSMINTFNSAVSDAIDKNAETYVAWFGKADFVPEETITISSDYNCGALCNDLEYCKVHNIVVTYTPTAPSNAVAELTICQILNMLRGVPEASDI